MIILGNVLCINVPRTDYAETDPSKSSFLLNKPADAIEGAVEAAENANQAAKNAQEAAKNAQEAADNAQQTADNTQEAVDKAQQTADEAQQTADEANSKADELLSAVDYVLFKTGGTMTGNINMGGNKVTGLGTPTEDSDAVPKAYIDDFVAYGTANLSSSGWSGKTQTVAVQGVSAINPVMVSPAPESWSAYCEAMVRCISQGDGTLTFQCDEVPSSNLTVNLVFLRW